MNEPFLKKKSILKAQYVYNAVLLLVLLLGVSYALVTFLYNEEGTSGSLTSSLVNIIVDGNTNFNLDNTSPVTDEVGLTGYSKSFALINMSGIDSLINVTIKLDSSNDIPASSIKYGLYINGVLKKIDGLEKLIIYDGLLLQHENVPFEVYFWVDESYTGTGTIFKGNFEVKSTEAVMTMADYVTKLVDKGKGVYKINNEYRGNDYRYSGLDVDNYIWFNCKNGTTGGANNCELWRIVGSLETKANEYAYTYRRVKIVKEDNLDNRAFGTNNTFPDSMLDTYLNGEYYSSLTSRSQKMVIDSEWNVGSSNLLNTPAASLLGYESKTKVYKRVGLLSASDIGYSTSTDNHLEFLGSAKLYPNSWLKGSSYYTLTPLEGNTTAVISSDSTSITFSSTSEVREDGVKPVVSLIPNVYIKAGNGTQAMPYEIELVDEEEHYSNVPVVGYVTYDVNGQTVTTPKVQAIYADGSTIINATLSDISGAKFKGWSTTSDGEVVYQKGDKLAETTDITLYAVWEISEYFVDKIINSVGTNGLVAVATDGTLYTDSTTQTIRDYRFSGYSGDVNNFVWFNNDYWRIIGVMPTQTEEGTTENLVKIIKAASLTAEQIPDTYTYNGVEMRIKANGNTVSWNQSKYFNQTNYNDWTQASLQYFLNDQTEGSASYYNGIDSTYKAMIQKSVYTLGNVRYEDSSTITPLMSYNQERSETVFDGNEKTWTGNIGLIYPSDFCYASNSALWNTSMMSYSSTNWLNIANNDFWTISPFGYGPETVLTISYNMGSVSIYGANGGNNAIYPVLYLKSDVKLVGGTGLPGDPYQITQ